ncbi:MAG: aminomethyl-transferring glycine dehydrogenase subunit GcvPB [Anaerolineae bacterium]
MDEPLLFELSRPGRTGFSLPEPDVPLSDLPQEMLREALDLPEVSEPEVVAHFTRLSQLNFSIDTHFYPLGSCTMKYNPKVNEETARFPGFARIHPLQDGATVQGALRLIYELERLLAEVSGMDAATLQPVAGAQGELTGLLMIRGFHLSRNDAGRDLVLVPDSAHGTNPATASMCGYRVVTVPSDARGNLDVGVLRSHASQRLAALMITNPNTLGLFEEHILEVAEIVHRAGGLIYCDGANMNALLGVAKPGQMGMDVLHLNLHKTFSTPHGGGGPGAGVTLVKQALEPFLPSPILSRDSEGQLSWDFDRPQSIGKVTAFYGNFAVLVRAFTYLRMLGETGLREVSEGAVIAANYLLSQLRDVFPPAYDRTCLHECILTGAAQAASGVRTLDIAKRLIDHGLHPPTIYFPLIVEEALMVEPTETESLETLDRFVAALREIAAEAASDPETVRTAPHSAPVRRLDEARAARRPNLVWRGGDAG